ncbi:MAG: hypothetical protein K8T25_04390 [Planctomycetia bacterium]|nr:hypothetical protein [Planctomycetia bacterium]
MFSSGSHLRSTLVLGLGAWLAGVSSTSRGAVVETSNPDEHRPGGLVDTAWQRFREADDLGVLALLHFSPCGEHPKGPELRRPGLAEVGSDADLAAELTRIRQAKLERYELKQCSFEKLDDWAMELKLAPQWQEYASDDWGNEDLIAESFKHLNDQVIILESSDTKPDALDGEIIWSWRDPTP